MTAEHPHDVIVATQRIAATPEVIFPYLTDPTLIVDWIGIRADLDPRAGGVFLLDMGDVTARGVYTTVEPPHRVVFTWGIPGNDALPPGGSTVEIVLTPDGDDTEVVLTHRGLPASFLDTHRAGWTQRLELLRAAVA